jgi:hypothetical protein
MQRLPREMLRARKNAYKANGISYYRPWVFLITDGGPTDGVSRATEMIRTGEEKKEFMFYPVGVKGADMQKLTALSVFRRAIAAAGSGPDANRAALVDVGAMGGNPDEILGDQYGWHVSRHLHP